MSAAVQNYRWAAFAGAIYIEAAAADVDGPAHLRIASPVPPFSYLLADDPCHRDYNEEKPKSLRGRYQSAVWIRCNDRNQCTEALQYINSIGDGDNDRIAVQGRIARLPSCHPAEDAVLHGGAVGLRDKSIGADGIAPVESARAVPE
jgi:hypothetical protein